MIDDEENGEFIITSRKAKKFDVFSEMENIGDLILRPPAESEVYKLISLGGFSSISLISFVAEREGIDELFVSTFRIGRKQFNVLTDWHNVGALDNVHIITSSSQEQIDRRAADRNDEYNYFAEIRETCAECGWDLVVYNNHSKLILMRTKQGNFYVVETSSNLNENPKIEHFSFENDRQTFEFYEKQFFNRLMKSKKTRR